MPVVRLEPADEIIGRRQDYCLPLPAERRKPDEGGAQLFTIYRRSEEEIPAAGCATHEISFADIAVVDVFKCRKHKLRARHLCAVRARSRCDDLAAATIDDDAGAVGAGTLGQQEA